MALNWTSAVFISIIAVVTTGSTAILAVFYAITHKNRPLLLLTPCWTCLTLSCLLQTLSGLFLATLLWKCHVYTFIPCGFFLVFLLDSLSEKHIGPLKLTSVTALSTAVVFISMTPGAVGTFYYPNGEIGIALMGNFRIVSNMLFLLEGGMYVFYMLRIQWSAPRNLKSYAWLNSAGASILGIGAPISVAAGWMLLIPGCHLIFISFGSLIITIAFILQPKLGSILPFKAMRLTVMKTTSGLSIFNHNWIKTDQEVESELFSGFLQALTSISDECFKGGHIREIHLEHMVLIAYRSDNFPTAFFIVSNKASRSLENALEVFAKRFTNHFSQYLYDNIETVAVYKPAADLVAECFPFIPEYD